MSGVLSVYALCVVVLCVKMFALSCYQGFYRIKSLAYTNREDAGYFNRPVSQQELPQVTRAAKAWANDLENIPLFFVLGGLCCALETSSGASIWLFCMFCVVRVLHSVCYLAGWQPWRTVTYAVGIVCLSGLGGMVGLKAVVALNMA